MWLAPEAPNAPVPVEPEARDEVGLPAPPVRALASEESVAAVGGPRGVWGPAPVVLGRRLPLVGVSKPAPLVVEALGCGGMGVCVGVLWELGGF